MTGPGRLHRACAAIDVDPDATADLYDLGEHCVSLPTDAERTRATSSQSSGPGKAPFAVYLTSVWLRRRRRPEGPMPRIRAFAEDDPEKRAAGVSFVRRGPPDPHVGTA